MSCERFEDRLVELACGELPPAEALEVESHAAGCASCREALAGMRATRRTMSALGAEAAPDAGERLLLAAGRAQAQRNAARRRRWIGLWVAPVAMAAGLALAVSWPLLSNSPGSPGREDPDALAVRGWSPPATPDVQRDDRMGPAGETEPAREAERAGEASPASKSAPAPAAPPARRAEPSSQTAKPGRYAQPPPRPSRELEPYTGAPQAPSRDAAARRELEGDTRAPSAAAREPESDTQAAPAIARAPAAERRATRSESGAQAPPTEQESAQEARAASEAPAPASAPSRKSSSRPPSSAGAALAPPAAPEPSAPSRSSLRAESERASTPLSGATSARARYEALRAAGQLRGEVRTFPGCSAEAWRKVETDPDGEVVRYVREGSFDGRRLRVEHLFDASGALVEAAAVDLDDADGRRTPARALGLDVPRRAVDASADARPRCEP